MVNIYPSVWKVWKWLKSKFSKKKKQLRLEKAQYSKFEVVKSKKILNLAVADHTEKYQGPLIMDVTAID